MRRRAHDRDRGRDVPARGGRPQRGQQQQDQQERTDDVDGNGALVVFQLRVFLRRDAGVGDHGVETRECGGARCEGLHRGVGAEIELPELGDVRFVRASFDVVQCGGAAGERADCH